MNRFGAIEKPTNILRLELPVDIELAGEDLRRNPAQAESLARKTPEPCWKGKQQLLDMHLVGSGEMCRRASGYYDARKHNCGDCSCVPVLAGEYTDREKTIDFTKETSKREVLRDSSTPESHFYGGPRPYQDMPLFRKIRRETTIRTSSVLCNAVYLFFWSVSDAILFYRENKDSYRIKFVKRYLYEKERCQNEQGAEQPEIHHTLSEDFRRSDADRLRGVSRLIETGLAPMVHGRVEADSHVLNQFNERILFFSSMSKLFTPTELKKIECMFKAGRMSAGLSSAKELCVGAQSNIMMQDVLKGLSSEQLLDFIHRLGYDIGPISATKYGAYVVQTVLELAKCEVMRSAIVEYFARYAACLVTHPLGNYSVQTVGTFSPVFLREVLLRNFNDIVKTHIGIRVLKKSLHVFSSARRELLEAIQGCSYPAKYDLLRLLERQDTHPEEDEPLPQNRE